MGFKRCRDGDDDRDSYDLTSLACIKTSLVSGKLLPDNQKCQFAQNKMRRLSKATEDFIATNRANWDERAPEVGAEPAAIDHKADMVCIARKSAKLRSR